ncbi:hypothetical protein Acr_04g0008270 [Actinidia rufa]|uniref:Uncharacterized protein n=1 Tax=Actinidia rufa TaxID=165716 RepID=A0A7J0EJG7_9ERIC|nr:hypothetical protein Acr_04g0008270 [Actinidia rufa]
MKTLGQPLLIPASLGDCKYRHHRWQARGVSTASSLSVPIVDDNFLGEMMYAQIYMYQCMHIFPSFSLYI